MDKETIKNFFNFFGYATDYGLDVYIEDDAISLVKRDGDKYAQQRVPFIIIKFAVNIEGIVATANDRINAYLSTESTE